MPPPPSRSSSVLDELEARVIRPVEVVEDEAQRRLAASRQTSSAKNSKVCRWTLSRLVSRGSLECVGLELQAEQATDERIRGIRVVPE